MTNPKLCSTAITALMISALPAFALEGQECEEGMFCITSETDGDRQGQGFVTVTTNDGDMVQLPIGIAARLCGEDASELAQGDRTIENCPIDVDDGDDDHIDGNGNIDSDGDNGHGNSGGFDPSNPGWSHEDRADHNHEDDNDRGGRGKGNRGGNN